MCSLSLKVSKKTCRLKIWAEGHYQFMEFDSAESTVLSQVQVDMIFNFPNSPSSVEPIVPKDRIRYKSITRVLGYTCWLFIA